MMGMGLYAKLNEAMIRDATAAGNARQDNAERNDRDNGRSPIAPEKRRENHIYACLGERAGQVFFPTLKWHAYKERNFDGTPDLGDFIDVKSNHWTGPDPKLIVKRDLRHEGDDKIIHDDWAYLLVLGCDHPYWWLAGWQWGKYIHASKVEFAPHHAYTVEKGELLPIHLLQRIVRERQ